MTERGATGVGARGTTDGMTPAQMYSLAFGATLLLVGLLGFAADSSFENGDNLRGDELIVFLVNGWHNLVHIASGLIGLAVFRSRSGARSYALGFGLVYLIVTIWGFADGNDVISLIPVNTEDNILHLLIALLGIGAGLASRDDRGAVHTTTSARTA
jgi:hypothetical protein